MIALCQMTDQEFTEAYQKYAPRESSVVKFGGRNTIAGRLEAEFQARRRAAKAVRRG
jgi:hypothetical protein